MKRRIISAIAICMILVLSAFPQDFAEAAMKVSYKMQKEEVTWKDGDIVRGIVSFQYPILKGSSEEISEINQVLEDAMKKYMADENVERIKESTEYYIKNKLYTDDVKQLYWKTTCKITYNANNIISMHMKEMWYAGGVYNQKDYGYTFNVKTGKALTAVDAAGVKAEEVTNKVLASAKKYFKSENTDGDDVLWNGVSSIIKDYDAKAFKFYLIPGKVRICFESYELGYGPGYQVFSITGKYK